MRLRFSVLLWPVQINDGRSYLERTQQQYDVITIDPPPPVESAGSSLLYSRGFYATIKHRLKPGGILQQWLPSGDTEVQAAVSRALQDSCVHVRAFPGVFGSHEHFLASDTPLMQRSPEDLAKQMPPAAVQDVLEWGPYTTPEKQFSALLDHEFQMDNCPAITRNSRHAG